MGDDVARAIWELVCSGDRGIDPDDLIRILENSGNPCPDDLAEEWS